MKSSNLSIKKNIGFEKGNIYSAFYVLPLGSFPMDKPTNSSNIIRYHVTNIHKP